MTEIVKNNILYKYEKGTIHSEEHHVFDLYEMPKEKMFIQTKKGSYESLLLSKCPVCKNYFIEKEYYDSIRNTIRGISVKNSYKVDKKYVGPYLTKEKRESMMAKKESLDKTISITPNRSIVLLNKVTDHIHPVDKVKFVVKTEIGEKEEFKQLVGYVCKKCNIYYCKRKHFDFVMHGAKPLFKVIINNAPVSIEKEENNKEESVDPEIIKKAQFLVKYSDVRCRINKHKIVDILAKINVVNEKGNILVVNVNAFYCYDCKRFFINNNEFERIKRIGNPLCPIYEESKAKSGYAQKFDLKMESLLHSFGYNVSSQEGLTDIQRQSLLKFLIDTGTMTKIDIISHLNYLINSRQGRTNMENAIYKWKLDMNYLNSLKGNSNIAKKQVDSIKIIKYI